MYEKAHEKEPSSHYKCVYPEVTSSASVATWPLASSGWEEGRHTATGHTKNVSFVETV